MSGAILSLIGLSTRQGGAATRQSGVGSEEEGDEQQRDLVKVIQEEQRGGDVDLAGAYLSKCIKIS